MVAGGGDTFDLLVGNQEIFLSCIVKGRDAMGSGTTGMGEDSEMEGG